ncbi:MBL fold metallo-hydrolase [Pseudoteredinibacter isoporae]|uniref:Metallo-beta-lactamase domain-containing protein n=1 Tax=Pseudoteredinibacter isoporae TaxID=570281 RepID=A0A7X0JU43_9GAMM|nr:MBL fold metallo-hydrolase [Pseudoteredinibacter isoporae]MBB6521470.1 hypothetical protein [Pseudoteredinibacter isoporae]NHO87024.1 MBL fold metallo-hydrolase [Pseudoteredinibacter isoporae]NIB24523.1 MBL fold metallo-hydrolase [Pseudoteredinibacter isoporae]
MSLPKVTLALCLSIITIFVSFPASAQTNVKQLADGVFHIWLDHYSSLVVIGENSILINDPANTERAKKLKAEIQKLSHKPVQTIVLSHEHYDHVGGSEVFEDAEIVCHRNCESVFQLDESNMAPAKVDTNYSDFLEIDLGTAKVNLHHVGAADGTATTLIHLPEQGIVASADMYEPKELTHELFMDDVNYLGVRRLLQKAVDLNPKHAINAHSPGTDPIDLIEGLKFVNDLYTQTKPVLYKTLQEGGFPGLMQAMPTLHKRIDMSKYQEWKNYEHLPTHVRRMALSIFHGG